MVAPAEPTLPEAWHTNTQEASVYKHSSLANPFAGATGIAVALAAALVAALATVFVFGATKAAEAQSQSFEVKPSTINLDQVALGSTEQTTIKITNDGGSATTIGGVNFSGSGAEIVKLVDQETNEEFIVDSVTGLLKVLNSTTNLLEDAVIDLQGNSQRVFNAVFSFDNPPGTGDQVPINGVLEFRDALNTNIVDQTNVNAEGRQCTVQGTEGNDTIPTDSPADEVICGLGGNDTIDATGGGDDTILGGPGNDTINMKDSVRREYANGGSGKDLCKPKDKKDRVKSCGTKKKGK